MLTANMMRLPVNWPWLRLILSVLRSVPRPVNRKFVFFTCDRHLQPYYHFSKIVELEEELRVVGNHLKSLEVSEEKVRSIEPVVDLIYVVSVLELLLTRNVFFALLPHLVHSFP